MSIPSAPRVFISYARKDGEAFATQLRQRLEREEPEITLWQDRAEMEGGVGWWKQITGALDRVQFLVIVMTPAALQSEITRKEWRYARQQGVCVYPIKGVPDSELDYNSLPNWMRKRHFFDLDKEWETFVNRLKSPCHATRVPFMATELVEGFVQRPAEFGQLLNYLLDPKRENPIAITTALHGSGGFGKTTLAAALCHSDEIITAFDDGILWATLGQTPHVQQELMKLYAALTGERPGFVDVEDAAVNLAQRLEDKNCLIVIDDVWDTAHLRPFLRGGKESCARLVTTRQFEIAADARRIDVDEMKPLEAVQMLTARLQPPPQDLAPFRQLAKRLGEWPLLLKLAAAALKQRMERGDTLERALNYVNRALDKRGVTAFDKENPRDRDQAVTSTIEISLALLPPEQRQHCLELAIFPEDIDIPLTTVGNLWGMDEFDTEDLVQRLDNFSLLEFSLQAGTIRLHDIMCAYLARQVTDPITLHSRLLDAWREPHCLADPYALRWLCYHMAKAGQAEALCALLLDYCWLKHKLRTSGVNALLDDFHHIDADSIGAALHQALRQAAHILGHAGAGWDGADQLASQLLARLLHRREPEIAKLLSDACTA